MGFDIQDGTGHGWSAKVDDTNRLEVRGVIEEGRVEGAANGETFIIGSPFLTQTAATENGLLYFQFDEDATFYATTFSSQGRYTTGGTFDNYLIQAYSGIQPSALTGTWVDTTPLNLNIGSSISLAGTFKYGSPAGATGFSGTPIVQLGFPINQFNQINTALVFPKGSSLLLTVTPPTSNTSMPVNFNITVAKLKL
jgi:hypothetical protein